MRDFTHEGFNTPGIMWFHLITLHIHLYCAINDLYTYILLLLAANRCTPTHIFKNFLMMKGNSYDEYCKLVKH